ncbi:hypothetical protein GYH30_041495 [Glycine max]|nr:hypothetical protein GYH30_041495 [Glycine max]
MQLQGRQSSIECATQPTRNLGTTTQLSAHPLFANEILEFLTLLLPASDHNNRRSRERKEEKEKV